MYVILLLSVVAICGVLFKRAGIVPDWLRSGIYKYVYFVASPVAVVHALVDRSNINYGSFFKFLAVNTGVYLAVFITVVIAVSRTKYKRKIAGVIAYASNTPNTVFLGFPLILTLFHQEAFIYAVVLGTLMDALLNSIRIAIIGRQGLGKTSHAKLILKSTLNPFLISLVFGILLLVSTVKLPYSILHILGFISESTSYAALFVLGITVGTLKLKLKYKKYYAFIAVGKLVLLPACVLIGSTLFGLNETARNVGVFIAALPSAVFSLIIAANLKLDEELATGAVLVTTCLSVLTLTFWYFLLTNI